MRRLPMPLILMRITSSGDRLKVIVKPKTPMDQIRVAMIEHDGAPIELMEINR